MNAPSQLLASSYVALGGAIGALLRYQTGRWLTWWLGPNTVTAFPWATLTVNVLGSLRQCRSALESSPSAGGTAAST